ncbi:uncharacterized protein BJ171DRAFT_112395 [Polychytrium aggregatum]|uniref:uncharacterized protein n=1 Tax=Polychytrium aggregatum TaxID=110093 RepID=UPI0022FF3A33|nr:uncharacterized protein BJ171DRAFT_112395 [Polychytrium aggregatum]KAI9209281.1 hypothetical protein BJ171DRAFT_112395 [Polychytrium aggregatum]
MDPSSWVLYIYFVTVLLWLATYISIIIVTHNDGTFGMPTFALSLQLTWAFCYSVMGPYTLPFDSFNPQVIVNSVILLMGSILTITTCRSLLSPQNQEFTSDPKLLAQMLPYAAAALFVFSFSLQCCFKYQFWDPTQPLLNQAYSFAATEVYAALAFVLMLMRRGDIRGQHWIIGASRFLSSIFNAIVSLQAFPTIIMGWMTTVTILIDGAYLALLIRHHTKWSIQANTPLNPVLPMAGHALPPIPNNPARAGAAGPNP